MKSFWQGFALLVLVWCSTGAAIADEYYQQFLAARGTNASGNRKITTPSLVDTNNTTFKATNFLSNLQQARAHGELGGIRLGMTMEEVVALWGKPRFFWSWCFGGPRLCYNDASVVFDPATNSVTKVRFEFFPHFSDVPSPALNVEECIQIIGQPTSRDERQDDLLYSRAVEKLRLHFSFDRRLFYAQLERLQPRKP